MSGPLDLASTVVSIVSNDPSRRRVGGTLRLAGRFGDAAFQLELHAVPGGVEADAWGGGAVAALDGLPALVGEHDDARGFDPTHKALRHVWRTHPGMRIGATDRPLDALIVAILAQKVTTTETGRSLQALARHHGEPAPGPDGLWVLPTAGTLARMAYHDFHPLGIERRRAETIVRIARSASRIGAAAAEGSERLDATLTALDGIGPWTSALVRDRALGDPDAVPVGDYHLPNAVAWFLAGEPRATDERMLELLEPYTGHRGRVLRLLKLSGVKPPKYGPRSAPRDIRGI